MTANNQSAIRNLQSEIALSRRTFLGHSFAGLGAVAMNSLFSSSLHAQSKGLINPLHHAAKAKRVIFLLFQVFSG